MPVEVGEDQDDPLEPGGLEALARVVMSEEGLDTDTVVSVTLVDRDEMTLLNQEHMGRKGPTDVLAFPIEDLVPGGVPRRAAGEPPLLLGDVVVCPAVVREQAIRAEVPVADEMALMVVHGMLHLLGYDHQADVDAGAMEQRERELLAAAGRVRP